MRYPFILVLGAWASFASATPLSLPAALQMASERAPQLTALAARSHSAEQQGIANAALPDPKITLGIDNLALNGEDRFALNRGSAEQSIGFMQELPDSRKRDARRHRGEAEALRWQAEARVEKLRIRRETALAWLNVYYLEKQHQQILALEKETRQLGEINTAQVAGWRAMPADVLMARDFSLQLADRQDELARTLAQARAQLARYVGSEGREPLQGPPPEWSLSDLPEQTQRPELAVFTPMRKMGEAELAEMNAEKNSDWSVELALKRRPASDENMAMVKFSFSLPLYASQRQDRQVQAREYELERLEAEKISLQQELSAGQEADLAEHTALGRQLARLLTSTLPLSEERTHLALAAYQSGQGKLADVFSARRDLLELQLRRTDLQARQHLLAARLHFSFEEIQP